MSPLQIINIVRSFIFGPMLVVAFLVGTFVFWKKGREEYYEQDQLMDVLVLSCLVGLVGARAGFIAVHFNEIGLNLFQWFSLLAYPGYVGMAGLVLGFVFIVWIARRRKWDAFEVADFAAIALSISMVFVFLGMFLNGSGFGNPTDWIVGMNFPGVFDRRHPTQLYATVLYLILFIVLWRLERTFRTFIWYRANRRTAQSGFVLSSFFIGYGLIGLTMAPFHPSFVSVGGIHVEAILKGIFVLAGVVLLMVRSGRTFSLGKKSSPPLREP